MKKINFKNKKIRIILFALLIVAVGLVIANLIINYNAELDEMFLWIVIFFEAPVMAIKVYQLAILLLIIGFITR